MLQQSVYLTAYCLTMMALIGTIYESVFYTDRRSDITDCKLKKKKIAVTGCTGGLGRELCFKLAAEGAEIIMVNRSPQRSEALTRELNIAFPRVKITNITADLENIDSVKSACSTLCDLKPDVFVSNAGAYSIPRRNCSTGYDNAFQINFISSYYLCRKLSENDDDIKIVAVGSIAHSLCKLNEGDIDLKSSGSAMKVYGNSKRFLMLSLHELFKERKNFSLVHPGISFTGITSNYPGWLLGIIKYPMKVIFPDPKKASECIFEGIIKDTSFGNWIGPEIFNIWGKPRIKRLRSCYEGDVKKISSLAENIYRNI